MNAYLFELFDQYEDNYVFKEFFAASIKDAKAKLFEAIPDAYISQVWTICNEKE